MTYDTSSEIYSLGIMLWEMWYGKEAFSEMKGKSLKVFLTTVEEGYRPQLQQLNTQVAFKLSQLLEECWTKDATKRRALEYCTSVIRDILSSQFGNVGNFSCCAKDFPRLSNHVTMIKCNLGKVSSGNNCFIHFL